MAAIAELLLRRTSIGRRAAFVSGHPYNEELIQQIVAKGTALSCLMGFVHGTDDTLRTDEALNALSYPAHPIHSALGCLGHIISATSTGAVSISQQALALVSAGDGRFRSSNDRLPPQGRCWQQRESGPDPIQELRRLITFLRSRYPLAFQQGDFNILQDVSPFWGHFLQGFTRLTHLLVVGDIPQKLAINQLLRERHFPYRQWGYDEHTPRQDRQRLDQMEVERQWDLALGRAQATLLDLQLDAAMIWNCFERVDLGAAFAADPVINAASQITLDDHHRLHFIEDPCVELRIEAALYLGMRYIQAGMADGITIFVPTTLAANHLYRHLLPIMQTIFGPSLPLNFIRRIYERVLVNGQAVNAEGWHHGIPFPATISVGPMTAEQKRIAYPQHVGNNVDAVLASRQLLVVDNPVSASGEFMAMGLGAARRHISMGAQVIITGCSCDAQRGELSQHMTYDTGVEVRSPACSPPPPSLRTSIRRSSTRITTVRSDGHMAYQATPCAYSCVLNVSLSDCVNDFLRTAELAHEHFLKGRQVLVLMSTVAGCIAVRDHLESLRGSGPPFFPTSHPNAPNQDPPLHSGYAATDKEDFELSLFRNYRDSSRRCLVVGTAPTFLSAGTLADVVIVGLAPVANLMEAAFLCRDGGRFIILTPPDHDLRPFLNRALPGTGIGGLHINIVELQWAMEQLQNHPTITLPQDYTNLCEPLMRPAGVEDHARGLGEDWHNHAQRMGSTAKAIRSAYMSYTAFGSFPHEQPSRGNSTIGCTGNSQVEIDSGSVYVSFGTTPPISPYGNPVGGFSLSGCRDRRLRRAHTSTVTISPNNVVPLPHGTGWRVKASANGNFFCVYDDHGYRSI
jgi:hypothetical protein